MSDTSSGCIILSTDVERKAVPVTMTKMATKRAEMYSIRPNPSGCECVGLRFEISKPATVTSRERESDALLTASERMATEPERRPTATLAAAISRLIDIPISEDLLSMRFRSDASTIGMEVYQNAGDR